MEGEAFSQIYQNYAKQVFRFLLNLSGNYDVAEELTQETFVRAYQKIDEFRGDCRLYVWLCQIGKNLYFNQIKKESNYTSLSEVHQLTSSVNVEEYVLEKGAVREIIDAVSKLPEPYQTVFVYHVFMQLSYQEISEALLKSEVWVRVTYYRAKKNLQTIFKEEKLNEM